MKVRVSEGIVRPSKKLPIFLFFIQSGKVQKQRVGEVGLLKLSSNTSGGGKVEGTLEDNFIVFCRHVPDFCTPKFQI